MRENTRRAARRKAKRNKAIMDCAFMIILGVTSVLGAAAYSNQVISEHMAHRVLK